MPSFVSPTIYVGRPDLLNLGHEVDYKQIDETLFRAAEKASEITILGGFYSLEPLIKLLGAVPKRRRRACRVRVAVGLEAASLIPRTWMDMRRLRDALLALGFKDPLVAIVDASPVHFHTKLFRFLSTTRPVWYVGSANPGSRRHELMLRVPGRHAALSAYVAAVFAKAKNVKLEPPDSDITTLRDFFMSGMLCHKPPVQRLFTFDAFQFEPTHRELLAAALAGTSGVDHASPTAQGFGFDLRSALGLANEGDAAHGARTKFRPYAIDTVFGWWMPRAYAADVRKAVYEHEAARTERFAKVGAALRCPATRSTARKGLDGHVLSMRSFLAGHGIDARPREELKEKFQRFLTSRTRLLNDGALLARHARSLTLTDMPDIWADGSAVASFEESFFEDLAYRAGGISQPRVVRAILDWLSDDDLSTPEDFRNAMISGLFSEPWMDDCWH